MTLRFDRLRYLHADSLTTHLASGDLLRRIFGVEFVLVFDKCDTLAIGNINPKDLSKVAKYLLQLCLPLPFCG
jgi:hypothetical protein